MTIELNLENIYFNVNGEDENGNPMTKPNKPYKHNVFNLEKMLLDEIQNYYEKKCVYDTESSVCTSIKDKIDFKIFYLEKAFENIQKYLNSGNFTLIKDNLNPIISRYEEIKKIRNNLKIKMETIHSIQSEEENKMLLYSNVLLTVLATSILLYIFVKL